MKKLNKIFLLVLLTICSMSVWGQQNDFETGVGLYQAGDYKAAVKSFEKFVKANPNDAKAQTYLASALLKSNRLKDAEKILGKSLAIDPNQLDARRTLAYVYMLRGKFEDAITQANVLVQANLQDAGVYYIIGWSNLRLGKFEEALENAELAINMDSNIANAYLLKAFAMLNGRFDKEEYKEKAARFGSVADNLGKFITLSKDLPNRTFWVGQEETLRRFANYYAQREIDKASPDNETAELTQLKITSKPRPNYTDNARYNGISGRIRLLIGFGEDGKVRDVLVLSSLGYGLDEEAVKAARKITFEPAKKDGKPIFVVKIVEYSFMIY